MTDAPFLLYPENLVVFQESSGAPQHVYLNGASRKIVIRKTIQQHAHFRTVYVFLVIVTFMSIIFQILARNGMGALTCLILLATELLVSQLLIEGVVASFKQKLFQNGKLVDAKVEKYNVAKTHSRDGYYTFYLLFSFIDPISKRQIRGNCSTDLTNVEQAKVKLGSDPRLAIIYLDATHYGVL